MVNFNLNVRDISVEFDVPETLWISASAKRDDWLSTVGEVKSKASLIARWIGFLHPSMDAELLTLSLECFHKLVGDDVHAQDDETLAIYYGLPEHLIRKPTSGVLSEQDRIYGLFGGQGPNEEYMFELQKLFDRYESFITGLILEASAILNLDLYHWLQSRNHPDITFTKSVLISLPLIGVTQLCQYFVTCKVLGITPGELRSKLQGVAGHSQGLVAAIAVAVSDSFESFKQNFGKVVKLLQTIGQAAVATYPTTFIDPFIVEDCANQEGVPTPMLGIFGASLELVQDQIDRFNSLVESDASIAIGLYNMEKGYIVCGPPKSLYGLISNLRQLRASPTENQARIPHSKRKPVFNMRFLPIEVPFHSKYLKGATDIVLERLQGVHLWNVEEIAIPVFNTESGMNMQTLEGDLIKSICDQIFVNPLNWPKVVKFNPPTRNLIDFGPGGQSGVGSLTLRLLEGTGVALYHFGKPSALYSYQVKQNPSWEELWAPKLERDGTGKIYINTALTRLTGKPPIWCCGMTPSTVSGDFVVAITNSGYSVELAGGGHYSAKMLRDKVDFIKSKIEPGYGMNTFTIGIVLNSLYINQKQFGFQYPLWCQLRKEGLPIEGLTIAAGIPSPEVANDIIKNLQDAGIKYVSFKPGSVDGLLQVAAIAGQNPTFPIIVQWTGGRAGGHHSFEDMHEPLLAAYAMLRKRQNLIVLVGSGLGDAEGAFPYLTGDWSIAYGYPKMPVDGILLGSRLMVAKECETSLKAKEAIAAASGVEDKAWEGTYRKETGGVITVQSELGEPIHKIATRGVKLWKELDDNLFSLPKPKRLEWLNNNRQYLIQRLNDDFQKPWFPKSRDGLVLDGVFQMTYGDVAYRMVELLYVKHQSRWIHETQLELVSEFLLRTEERFIKSDEFANHLLELKVNPYEYLVNFFTKYPTALIQPLSSEDIEYFLVLCRKQGCKPVPFITTFDNDFEIWFKKDSLWQSEDLDAVVDQDVGRVCILQGPVAVKFSNVVNEPVKEILDSINEGIIERLLRERFFGVSETVPMTISEWPSAEDLQVRLQIDWQDLDDSISVRPPNSVKLADWIDFIVAIAKNEALDNLMKSPVIWSHQAILNNPVPKFFVPSVENALKIQFIGSALRIEDERGLLLVIEDDCINIYLTQFEATLELKYRFFANCKFAPVQEILDGRHQRINQFYHQIWFNKPLDKLPSLMDVFECENEVTCETVRDFCGIIQNFSPAYVKDTAPMDYSIVLGWKAMILPLFSSEIQGDLLKLVHLSNSFEKLGHESLKLGQVVRTRAKVTSVAIIPAGKVVKVVGIQSVGENDYFKVTSEFLFRGQFQDYESCFSEVELEPRLVKIKSKKDINLLLEKKWFKWIDQSRQLNVGDELIFRCESHEKLSGNNSISKATVIGHVYQPLPQKEIAVATVFGNFEKTHSNPIIGYFERHSTIYLPQIPLENEYVIGVSDIIKVPSNNMEYSLCSGDTNPIHVNSYFSGYVGLPGTITHGMWTSAATRKVVDLILAPNQPNLVQKYSVNFEAMVLPNDLLRVKLYHVGMRDGAKVIRVLTMNQKDEIVLQGMVEVLQENTCFVFTGQGSQEQGMGMDLYQISQVARDVWDKADAYLQETYSFSIIDIVKNNPVTKTIYFGGFLGQKIRERYMSMTYDTVDKDGNLKRLALFPDITLLSTSYTFSSPKGLLYSTQFAQIALVVTEKASFDHLKSLGLVGKALKAFAGHSLGEYAALASITDFLTINALCDVVFYRGLTMQRAVERDSRNRSNYGMCAVNPSRINSTFSENILTQIVAKVAEVIGGLCEIVNYNVENQQYVVAGELVALETLSNTLNYLKEKKVDFVDLLQSTQKEEIVALFTKVVQKAFTLARDSAIDGVISLKRGYATIPLSGIDIPFHSAHIWAGVGPFRSFISQKIDQNDLNVDTLIGKYIPNLVAVPFSLEKSYVELVYEQTKSPHLDAVLKKWGLETWDSPSRRQKLGYIILVELLAYQFASPVRWIETQDQFFEKMDIRRMIEVGPSPILTGMAIKTLSLKYSAKDTANAIKRQILCLSKNSKEAFYSFAEEIVVPEAETKSEKAPNAAPVVQVAPAAEPTQAHLPVVNTIPDEPVKAENIIRVLIALKLKKTPGDISMTKSIKDLVGGKSTMQNEIIGDLQAEFSNLPERSEEIPLEELAAAIQVVHNGRLNKHMLSLVYKLVANKFSGGFALSNAQDYLKKRWGLGPQVSESVLLTGLIKAPGSRLGTEAEVKAWLDSVVKVFASENGIVLSDSSTSNSSGASQVMRSEEFDAYTKKHDEFVEQHVELYMRYLGKSSRQGSNLYLAEKVQSANLQLEIDSIAKEHGDHYLNNIKALFDVRKARKFDSSWNWVRQDAYIMWFDMIFGRLTIVDRDITAKAISILNRSDSAILDYISFYINSCIVERGETYQLAKELGAMLLENCETAIAISPKCKDVNYPAAPQTIISENGEIVYSEINRPDIRKLLSYVQEMAAGNKVGVKLNLERVQKEVSDLYEMVRQQPQISNASKDAIQSLYDEVMRSLQSGQEDKPTKSPKRLSTTFVSPSVEHVSISDQNLPYLHLRRNIGGAWTYSKQLSCVYLDVLTEIATAGSTFENTVALLTGCGNGSIGAEVLKGLLSGGCTVIVTTSSYSRKTVEYFQNLYQVFGANGSKLIVVPFNQASKQDVESLVDYIYSKDGLDLDLDYIVPFAAISENGREIDSIDDQSELAHRLMLTNLIRLIGSIKRKKESRRILTRPTQIIMPLSPNHGVFGGDGLYAESKLGLETLFNKWRSESWGQYLSLVGAVIGWTRGTGLMNSTNILAEGVEKHGVRTFSAKEMGFNILGLMHPTIYGISSVEPLWADLSGGMLLLPELNEIMNNLRSEITEKAEIKKALYLEYQFDCQSLNGPNQPAVKGQQRANNTFAYPSLPSYEVLKHKLKLSNFGKGSFCLEGMINLDKTAVIVGFAEVGPLGSSRTRWEMECHGDLSIDACIELGRMMGYIKFFSGRLKDNSAYVGWIEVNTGNPISDDQVKERYKDQILEHIGIRFIEPAVVNGYDPKKKIFTQEIILNHDLEPLVTSHEEALQFKLKHDDKVDIWCNEDESKWFVKFKKGATVSIPKAMPFDRLVAGQIPTGWDAKRYGVPQDIIDQVDPCTLWSLVATAEALASAGIADPYELFEHVHVSEVGNALGSGMGGQQAMRGIFRGRYEGKDVQNDILQESFINTTAGWINLLLMSASGPVKIPVGACATALQSLEIGVDCITSGKARVMVCGGVDDFTEEGSTEFANMKATSNSATELAQGRSPTEMSRPTTSTRAGFMEAQGAGVQIMMQASLAIKMGLPILGVVALTNTAMDKQGRSVPAPGQGILSTAKELKSGIPSPRLDLQYRRRQLEFRCRQIDDWLKNELELAEREFEAVDDKEFKHSLMSDRLAAIDFEHKRMKSEAKQQWGSDCLKNDPTIAPLRGALATFGLDINDVGVVSFHGTSTVANDKNESEVTFKQFSHLGRSKGNGCPVIAQKWLTGHPKGAAAAWMANGLMQSILSGVIPGNRNADNISPELEKYDLLFFPSKSIQTDGIKAGLLKSFGFGQVGGEALFVHPEYLLSSLSKQEYESYRLTNQSRWKISYRILQDAMVHENLVKLKNHPPYSPELETPVLLNPLHRAKKDGKGSYTFDAFESIPSKLSELLKNSQSQGVGVDTEMIDALSLDNPIFVERNYTLKEIEECKQKPDARASFTGRWTAKEAVVKAISSLASDKLKTSAAAPLKDIEILSNSSGVPTVTVHGQVKDICDSLKIKEIKVSISHSDAYSVSVAVASAAQ